VYDGDRMVSSYTEPEWSDEDRDMMLAHTRLELRTGPSGEYLPEATSDAASPENATSPGYGYVAKGPFTNWAQKAKQDAWDARKKSLGENANMNGVYFTVDRFDY
jgi:hypothetical protein